eukprot:COSAG03_NODE_5210_length_1312_cov_629.593570_1_plen_238_part_10
MFGWWWGLRMRDEAWLASRRALSDAADARLARSAALALHNAHTTERRTTARGTEQEKEEKTKVETAERRRARGTPPPPPLPPAIGVPVAASIGGELAELHSRLQRSEEERAALEAQLQRERKLREDADGALQWLTQQVKRAGVSAAVAAGPVGPAKTRALSVPASGRESGRESRFTRALLTREEAEAAVEQVETHAERRVRSAEDELLTHLAAGSIQRHSRARRDRKALVELGRLMVT